MPDRLTFPEAWSTVPALASIREVSERFTRDRMERILAIIAAIGGAALGAQTFLSGWGILAQASAAHNALFIVVNALLAATVIVCLVGHGVRLCAGLFAVVYTIALALWPVLTATGAAATTQPWILFPLNIATAAAILAFPLRWQAVFVVALPFIYGFVRITEGKYSEGFWVATAFDVSFTLMLGGVMMALAWMLRSVALGVDEARSDAVASYAQAAAEAAAEEERVAVAALMHDSVLAALIAAERAASPRERELAVTMAREALTRLANTEEPVAPEGGDAPVAWTQLLAELRRMLEGLSASLDMTSTGETEPVPERVARAVVLAARQAYSNALQHANGAGLHVRAEADGAGFAVMVCDAGPGFDLAAVAPDRLGIQASILARMTAVAGSARIQSSAAGTEVTLSWPQK